MSDPTPHSEASLAPGSPPSIGLPTLAALVIANMIGAGVFTSSGFSLAALGSPGRVMLTWWLCGVWAICGAIAYGALVKRLPMSGGEYLFLSRFVHPSIGFLAGWISVIAGFTAPIAAAALGAAVYVLPNAEPSSPSLTYLACGVIALATACHLVGLSIGGGVQNVIVTAKLLLIFVIIGWAFLATPTSAWNGYEAAETAIGWLPIGLDEWTVLVGSMSWIALSYTGFNAAIYVAGESRNARSNVPRAMLLATVLVTIIYLLLNYVFLYAPAPEAIFGQERVASIAAKAVGGIALESLVRLTIVLAMTSSVFAMLLAGPRVYQKMAEDGVMPAFLKSAGQAPRLAITVQAALSIVALLIADLLQLMKYLGLTLSACGALAVLSLWWARKKLPDAAPLRIWEQTAVVVYLAITACILLASRTTHADEFIAMLCTFAVGGCVYGIWTLVDSNRKATS